MNKPNLQLLVSRLETQLDSSEAARFNMRTFGQRYSRYASGILTNFPPVCETQACLAGEAVLALGKAKIHIDGGILLNSDTSIMFPSVGSAIQMEAIRELDLTITQAKKLFYFKNWTVEEWGWPEKFENMYTAAKTPQGRLYAAIRRVEHFIKTNGRQ